MPFSKQSLKSLDWLSYENWESYSFETLKEVSYKNQLPIGKTKKDQALILLNYKVINAKVVEIEKQIKSLVTNKSPSKQIKALENQLNDFKKTIEDDAVSNQNLKQALKEAQENLNHCEIAKKVIQTMQKDKNFDQNHLGEQLAKVKEKEEKHENEAFALAQLLNETSSAVKMDKKMEKKIQEHIVDANVNGTNVALTQLEMDTKNLALSDLNNAQEKLNSAKLKVSDIENTEAYNDIMNPRNMSMIGNKEMRWKNLYHNGKKWMLSKMMGRGEMEEKMDLLNQLKDVKNDTSFLAIMHAALTSLSKSTENRERMLEERDKMLNALNSKKEEQVKVETLLSVMDVDPTQFEEDFVPKREHVEVVKMILPDLVINDEEIPLSLNGEPVKEVLEDMKMKLEEIKDEILSDENKVDEINEIEMEGQRQHRKTSKKSLSKKKSSSKKAHSKKKNFGKEMAKMQRKKDEKIVMKTGLKKGAKSQRKADEKQLMMYQK